MPQSTGIPASLSASSISKITDLEVKDAQIIFDRVWMELELEFGRENLRFPKEIILLGGAPGAGKGTNTPFILKARGLTCDPIIISSLLTSPEAKRIKDAGGMVGDRQVMGLLFRKLLEPQFINGAIVDGFPRTKVQVECLKLLYSRLNELWREHSNTPLAVYFRRPIYHIMVLFVDEKESIARQIKRGREVKDRNEELRRTGGGQLLEERVTDLSEEAARNRYRVFKEKTYDALQELREVFHYHFINAQGSIDEVQSNIIDELKYQSSLELDPKTFDRLRCLPLASEIVVHARQELVRRLDTYEIQNTDLFKKIISFIETKIMPIVRRHALSGRTVVNTEEMIFEEPMALAMLIDIFSERGYHAVVDLHKEEIPEAFDLNNGKIYCRTKKIFRIQIHFVGSEIRRG